MQFRSCCLALLLYGLQCLASFAALSDEPPGSFDRSFLTSSGANATVQAIAVQDDQKILIGGDFDLYSGATRHRLARINPNGSIDTTFDSPINDPVTHVLAVAVQSDGQILAGADTEPMLRRLSSIGALDPNFNVGGSGPNGAVHAIVMQPDGKILIGGEFTRFNGVPRGRIARLNSDGSLDNTFNPSAGADYHVLSMALQADGRILIGGQFLNYGGVPRKAIARLTSAGGLDNTFTPGQGADAVALVATMAIQTDGKAVIGGGFTTFDGHNQIAVARLNTNGTYDATFQSNAGLAGTVFALQLQRDGKVIVAGDMSAGHLVRLNTDGSTDADYQPGFGPGDDVYAMATQRDQKIVIGGLFEDVDLHASSHLARIHSDLKMLAPAKNGSQFSAQIQTVSGRSYRLEYKSVLDDSPWIPIIGWDVVGNGLIQSIRDVAAGTAPRFYRVYGFAD